MSTKNSPIHKLNAEAGEIARTLKRAERREPTLIPAATRDKPTIKVGIVMDDKVLSPEISWETIGGMTQDELARWIVDEMREIKHVRH